MKIIVFLFLGLAVCGCRQSQPAASASSPKTVGIDFGNIAAVHEKFGKQTAHVTVKPKQSTNLDFTFHAAE